MPWRQQYLPPSQSLTSGILSIYCKKCQTSGRKGLQMCHNCTQSTCTQQSETDSRATHMDSADTPTHTYTPTHIPVVKIVELVCLKVVFISRMSGGGAEQQVHPIPEESKRRGIAVELRKLKYKKEFHSSNQLIYTPMIHTYRRCDTRKVVQMLYGMHTQARKWLNVSISVMN